MPQSHELKNCAFLSLSNEMRPTIALLNRAAHLCTALFNERLVGVDLSAKSVLILGAALNNTSFSQQDIAKGVFIDRSTMVSLVDDLELRGLVERTRHVDDRRQYRVLTTPKGEALLTQALEIACQTEDEFLSVLDDAQKISLRGALLRVLDSPMSTLLPKCE